MNYEMLVGIPYSGEGVGVVSLRKQCADDLIIDPVQRDAVSAFMAEPRQCILKCRISVLLVVDGINKNGIRAGRWWRTRDF